MSTSHAAGGDVIALDVGGTAMKGAVLGPDLVPREECRIPTGGHEGPDAVVRHVLDALAQLRGTTTGRHAVAAGLVVPGIVDPASGTAVWSENLGWKDVPFKGLAAEHLGLPVAFGHDVRAGALAEFRVGAGAGSQVAAFVPLGTGTGVVLALDGQPVDAGPYSGELGHIDVGHDERCACGARGCLEAICSVAALPRRYLARRAARGFEDIHPSAVDARAVVLAAKDDHDAEAVWSEAIDGLARALAVVASLFAPQVVILGGGLAQAAEDLTSPLADRLDALLTFQPRPSLRLAALGDRAGCLGAGLLAHELAASA